MFSFKSSGGKRRDIRYVPLPDFMQGGSLIGRNLSGISWAAARMEGSTAAGLPEPLLERWIFVTCWGFYQ